MATKDYFLAHVSGFIHKIPSWGVKDQLSAVVSAFGMPSIFFILEFNNQFDNIVK